MTWQATTAAVRANPIARVHAYSSLTKSGIAIFVGISAAAGYAVTAGSRLQPGTLALLMIATMLASGGAGVLNQVAERLSDGLMRRTASRPLPAGIISPGSATIFGWTLSALGGLVSLLFLPPLTFVFLAACHVSYVFVYTPLKKHTPLCTLVGAIPGALPVLAGSAALGGMPGWPALVLTGLLFSWQIPHFYAIGWITREDYARAEFKMLTVTDETGKLTARACLLYAIATHGFAILATREVAAMPLITAAVHSAGTAYIVLAFYFMRARTNERARRLFFASLIVLPVMLGSLLLNAYSASDTVAAGAKRAASTPSGIVMSAATSASAP